MSRKRIALCLCVLMGCAALSVFVSLLTWNGSYARLNAFQIDPAPIQPILDVVRHDYEPVVSVSKEFPGNYAQALKRRGVTLHPGTEYDGIVNPDKKSLDHCQKLVYEALAAMPSSHSDSLKDLTLYFADQGSRGLGGASRIILRCQNVTDAELVGVFVHELGHVVDASLLAGTIAAGRSEFKDGKLPLYKDDPSLDFYRLSWKDSETLKPGAKHLDFISGYAMTDPFEDFAEAYVAYVIQGDQFRELALSNAVLGLKYAFLRDEVFGGREFSLSDARTSYFERPYDTTVQDYRLNDFLASESSFSAFSDKKQK